MSEIPKEFMKCGICLHAVLHHGCIGCADFKSFLPDYDKICKWCWNKVADGDNVCAEHRKSHNENSWPGCLKSNNEMPRTCASCKHKKERVLRGHRVTTSAFCNEWKCVCPKTESCERYEARFEKLSVNQVVKMEDYLL